MGSPPAHGGAAAPPGRPDTLLHIIEPITVSAPRPRTTAGGASAADVALDSVMARPAPTLEEVLRTLPLVVVRVNSRGEAQPALRGGEDRQIAVLVDGVPITLAWDHRTDLSLVPLTAARTVTLHRGFSSLLLGPNALAGAVEVDIARRRRAESSAPTCVLDAAVDHAGSRSVALTAGTAAAGGDRGWQVRAGGGYRGSEGFVLPRALARSDPVILARLTADGARRLNTDVEAFNGFLALRGISTGGAWASLTAAGQRTARGVPPEAHTQAPRLWRYPYQARGLGALSAGTGMRATPWGQADLEASLGVDAGRAEIEEFDGLDYRTVVRGERDDDRTLTARVLGDHTLGARGDLRLALTYADISHDEAIDGGPPASYAQRIWSLASETDWRLGSGGPLRVSMGGAVDGADTPESADKPPLGRRWDWAARAGATLVLREGTLLAHGSGGRRVRFPSLRELYSGALGRFLANPALRPEAQWAGELGVTWRRAAGELQVVGFVQSLRDAITRIPVPTPAGNRFQRVNQGRIEARGVEVLGRVAAGGLAVGGSATAQRVRGMDAADRETELEYEPALHGGVWAEAGLPGQWRLGLEAGGTGAQRFIDLDSGAFATLARGLRVDLRLWRGFALGAFGPWRRVDAQLAVENVADQVLFDQAGLPRPGRTVRLQGRLH